MPIGDGGAVLSIRGSLKAEGSSIKADADHVTFHKGGIVVFLLAGAQGGPVVSGQGVELAQKVAARLT